ncbi:MAG: putative exported protein [Pseudomonadota bacterium]|jgi:ketosteroid isomerase-like protein
MKNRILLLLAAALSLFSLQTLAGPLDEALFRKHLAAIANGQLDAVQATYAPDALLDWVGGNLEGRYSGAEAIGKLWRTFHQRRQPMQITVDSIESHANDKGATVIASVIYKSTNATTKVRQIITLRDGRIHTEIWQIAPALLVKSQ